jgi:hypothetical protein
MIISPLGNPNLGIILRPVVTNSLLPIELSPQVSIAEVVSGVSTVRPIWAAHCLNGERDAAQRGRLLLAR